MDTAKAEIDSMKRRLIILPFGAAVLHLHGAYGWAGPCRISSTATGTPSPLLFTQFLLACRYIVNEKFRVGLQTRSKALPTWIPSSPSALPPPLSTGVCHL